MSAGSVPSSFGATSVTSLRLFDRGSFQCYSCACSIFGQAAWPASTHARECVNQPDQARIDHHCPLAKAFLRQTSPRCRALRRANSDHHSKATGSNAPRGLLPDGDRFSHGSKHPNAPRHCRTKGDPSPMRDLPGSPIAPFNPEW